MHIHLYEIIKNRGPGPYNSLRHADNGKCFSGLSVTQNPKKNARFTWRGKWEKLGVVLADKKVTILISDFKYGQT